MRAPSKLRHVRIYVMENDPDALVARFKRDFPNERRGNSASSSTCPVTQTSVGDRTMPTKMKQAKVIFAIIGLTSAMARAASADPLAPKPHPWCPPFGLTRVGSAGGTLEFEADALPRVEPVVNPVDLGTILPPHGWLLVGPGQAASVEVAAISRRGEELDARLRAWFSSEPDKAVSTSLSLPANERVQRRVRLPPIPSKLDRDVVHVTIERPNGDVLWQKDNPSHVRA